MMFVAAWRNDKSGLDIILEQKYFEFLKKVKKVKILFLKT